MTKRILAVGHDAYRAGAQIVFLHILRWLRENHDSDISLVLNADGDLLPDYQAVLPTTVLSTLRGPNRRTTTGLPHKVKHRLRPRASRLRSLGIGSGRVDLVYANSMTSAHLGASIATELGCPAICHVHELEMAIRATNTPTRLREAIGTLDGYIAVSQAVQRNLVENHGIAATNITLVPECIPIPRALPDARARAELKANLGIPSDAFVIGGSGTVDWRKGPDVFLLVASAVARRSPSRPVHFLWVGGEPRRLMPVEYDLTRLGLHDSVHFVGVQADPAPYFALFDSFLLSSREDPFPLVCLEAASMHTPIVCFADAGGMPEFVEDDAGYVVPYLDIESAADRLLSLADADEIRTALGRRAATKVAERCSIDVVGAQIGAVLDQYSR